jgi:hypothetical protein
MDEFFILLDHTIYAQRSQFEEYLGSLRIKSKSHYVSLLKRTDVVYMILMPYMQKKVDKAIKQIAVDNKDMKLDWKGWSERGKNGLLNLLEMMVNLRATTKSSIAGANNDD